MKKILIFGSGSIGNHMAHACVSLGWNVFITDINNHALERMKNEIYPKRYKKWNNKITQINYTEVFKLKFKFDLIILGTPPITHVKLFNECKKNLFFLNILIEKPIAEYSSKKVINLKKEKNFRIFCGYNHTVNPSMIYFFNLLNKFKKNVSDVSIDWKEGWQGILGAHPWLNSEFDSYLGNYKLGGGAIQEHSHGIHVLICILNILNIKNDKYNKKIILFKKNKKTIYDFFSTFAFVQKDIFFKYETDLISIPPKKNIYVKFKSGYLKWVCNFESNCDAVIIQSKNKKSIKKFKKTRSSEFKNELQHILRIKTKKQYENSNVSIYKALDAFKIMQNLLK
jgi:hypothetical protein